MIVRETAVVMKVGPLVGFKGVIVSRRLERVVVRLVLQQGRSILVELDDDMIEYDKNSTLNHRKV
jgi:hypothetical protein